MVLKTGAGPQNKIQQKLLKFQNDFRPNTAANLHNKRRSIPVGAYTNSEISSDMIGPNRK